MERSGKIVLCALLFVSGGVAGGCGGSSTTVSRKDVDHSPDAGSGVPDGAPSNDGASAGGASADGASAGGASAGGAGGVDAGGSGTGPDGGGGKPGTVSPYAACVQYLNAECNRAFYECEGYDAVDDPCPQLVEQCPDWMFADGSTRTIDSVLACVETWKKFPCSEIALHHFPPCATPGTRTVGDPCIFDNQCASGHCADRGGDTAHPSCGACVAQASPGGQCGNLGPLPACPTGYECGCSSDGYCSATGTCAAEPPFLLPLGSPCERFGQCADKARCYPDPNDPAHPLRCQVLPKLGEPCPTIGLCEDGAYCNSARMCVEQPAAGQPCAVNTGGPLTTSTCDATSFCDLKAPGGPTCVKRAGQGERCNGQKGALAPERCQTGLFCACSDPACTSATCSRRLEEGEGCGEPDTACPIGTTCQEGMCVAVVSIGLFAAACGP